MVTLLSVKSSQRITVKVAMIEVGIATAAISVARRLAMNSITVRLTRMPASTRWSFTSSIDRSMKRDWSRTSCDLDVGRQGRARSLARRFLTVSMTCDGVGAGLLAHQQRDGRLAVEARDVARLDEGVLDRADVADA